MTTVDEWLALMRVHESDVTAMGGRFFSHGQSVADYLATALDELLRTECLALGKPTPTEQQQVCVTHAGQVRYVELTGNEVREARHGDR